MQNKNSVALYSTMCDWIRGNNIKFACLDDEEILKIICRRSSIMPLPLPILKKINVGSAIEPTHKLADAIASAADVDKKGLFQFLRRTTEPKRKSALGYNPQGKIVDGEHQKASTRNTINGRRRKAQYIKHRIGLLIRAAREEKGWDIKYLGIRAEIKDQAIRDIEMGIRSIRLKSAPGLRSSRALIERIAEVLRIDVSEDLQKYDNLFH